MVTLAQVLESAARLQQLVPGAVLVGGSAAAFHAEHRDSEDHDHVLADLAQRFDAVLAALESDPQWVLNRATPGKIVLGELGGIEAGVRQLIRRVPLEVEDATLPSGQHVAVPTAAEALRVKAWLLLRRNQTRDYLDVAALSGRFGTQWAGEVLASIDDYYSAENDYPDPVATQVARQLAEPRPRDTRAPDQLDTYKGLQPPWTDWARVVQQCQDTAAAILERG